MEKIYRNTSSPQIKEFEKLLNTEFSKTKAEEGHDINISFEEAAALIGDDLAEEVKKVSLQCYIKGAELAKKEESLSLILNSKWELLMGILFLLMKY